MNSNKKTIIVFSGDYHPHEDTVRAVKPDYPGLSAADSELARRRQQAQPGAPAQKTPAPPQPAPPQPAPQTPAPKP
jgi:glutamate-1-semialdehyde aminotransferase